jgi:bidirectional [NiFe] hydrogenase diaphorase subunit
MLQVKPGETTADGNISLMTARCVGACGRAPVILEDGELVGLVETATLVEQLERWAIA